MAVLVVGTLDTKGAEVAFVRDLLERDGSTVLVLDVGVLREGDVPADVGAAEVAAAGGADLEALRAAGDRGAALRAMARGAAALVRDLVARGEVDGLLGLGGSGGSSVVAEVVRELPVGLPKLLVSTMASGDVSAYVGEGDLTLMHSVVDLAGLNVISRAVLRNAAAAIGAMASSYAAARTAPPEAGGRPLVAATMFGVTTPAVEVAKAELEERGYDVVVFHATGSGGRAMEALVRSGFFAGVLDLTTTEVADEVVGGVLSAGPGRLTGAAELGVPQVVSLGAVDMVNFGPRDSVPPQFDDRTLLVHNDTVTLMRTTPEEATVIGRTIGERVARSTGPVVAFVPAGGTSAIDVVDGPFWDPEADRAAAAAFREALAGTVEVVESDDDVNAPTFARAMARRLHDLVNGTRGETS
ncbi:Tm-1-like ATP-binding domain-containing protein [Nocardioides litoris]|uniref:Tm-1-like ATP-binding domain-containing protein n=1 Tax=Nocardioides litoris TaxID=1926648 RepID=UPI001123FF17|nr:Tm-1-like ATP-binding domain-containing protein [Nocardioides litoris]